MTRVIRCDKPQFSRAREIFLNFFNNFNLYYIKMPIISDRKKLIYQIGSVLKLMAADGLEETQEFIDFIELRVHLECTRTINPIHRIPKSSEQEKLLWYLPEREFKLLLAAINNHL